jgi:hypothetical protein
VIAGARDMEKTRDMNMNDGINDDVNIFEKARAGTM